MQSPIVSISFQNYFLPSVREVKVICPDTLFRIISQSLINKDQQLFTEYQQLPTKNTTTVMILGSVGIWQFPHAASLQKNLSSMICCFDFVRHTSLKHMP